MTVCVYARSQKPPAWDVDLPREGTLGEIRLVDDAFIIVPVPGLALDDIETGPYGSKQDAMEAIGAYLGRDCIMGRGE
jgi:hypothetical protein